MPRFRGFSGRSASTSSSRDEQFSSSSPGGDSNGDREDVMSISYPPPKHHPLHLFRGASRSKARPAQQPWTTATSTKSSSNGSPADDMSGTEDANKRAPPSGDLTNSQSMASAYCLEWERLFMVDDYWKKLKEMGMEGDLRSSRFRSVCWKLYLECLPENRREWISSTRTWRKRYEDLKQKLIINPRKAMDKADLSINNPLSQEEESPWNQFFQDNELRLTIKQDVIRTYPKIDFFHTDHIRTMMVDGLFIYAKLNPECCYRQGMHELLAPLIFVLHCDHQAFLHACEIETIEPVVKEILNPEFIEHDAFTMFCQIMGTVEPWYVSKEISPTVKKCVLVKAENCTKIKQNSNIFTAQPFARQQDLHPSNVIITKLTRIQDYVLKRFDPDLHAHLEKMEIAPQIYGIRWVRLLFGRELPMQDLLVLWDAIFADGISFDLVDYIFVGMLQYIRDLLLMSDYPTCLTTLMKFPPVGDVHYFIEKALYLREPTQYPKPRDYVYQKTPLQATMSNSQLLDRVTKSYTRSGGAMTASVMSSLSSLTRKLNQSRPQHLGLDSSPKKISKSTSEPMNLLTDESPEYRPTPEKRGSTASLSKLESGLMGLAHLRPASSSQSLARLETTGGSLRSAGSVANMDQLSPDERTSPPSASKFSTLPSRGKKAKKMAAALNKERNAEHEIAVLMGRLHDMEAMCRQCSLKMGKHIDKLQMEMLHQNIQNEDELLLALAGLKQVRDVLKGILKPCNIFDEEEIHICDDYYRDDNSLSEAAAPSMPTSRASHPSSPERRRAAHAAAYKTVNHVGDESSPDSSSPEYTENVRPGTLPAAAGASSGGRAWERQAEIEMISLRSDVARLHRQLSNASDNGSTSSGGAVSEEVGTDVSGHRRSYSVGNHEFDIFDPNQNKTLRASQVKRTVSQNDH